jgi:hypothetical protein
MLEVFFFCSLAAVLETQRLHGLARRHDLKTVVGKERDSIQQQQIDPMQHLYQNPEHEVAARPP